MIDLDKISAYDDTSAIVRTVVINYKIVLHVLQNATIHQQRLEQGRY